MSPTITRRRENRGVQTGQRRVLLPQVPLKLSQSDQRQRLVRGVLRRQAILSLSRLPVAQRLMDLSKVIVRRAVRRAGDSSSFWTL